MNEASKGTQGGRLGGIALAFFGGAALGAGAAILFAPQSGRKTRRQISDMVEDAEDFAQDLAHDAGQGLKSAKAKGVKLVHQARDFVNDKKSQLASSMSTDGAKD